MNRKLAPTRSCFVVTLLAPIALAFAMPALGQHGTDGNSGGSNEDENQENDPLRALLRNLTPWGPIGTSLPAGAQHVDRNQFLDLLISGAAQPMAPRKNRDDARDDKPAVPDTDALHERAVMAYLLEHPELTDLARLVTTEPKEGRGSHRNADGTWTIQPDGVPHPVETMGRSAKLSWVYDSIMFARSRTAQLDLYTRVYNSLAATGGNTAAGATGVNVGQFPTPMSLVDAQLPAVTNALRQVGQNWPGIISQVAHGLGPIVQGCDAETGATPRPASGLYGDRSGSNPLCVAIPGGLYDKINFFNKSYPTCVKDQGRRGTCHTFGVTSATEELYSLRQGVKVNLSEQDEMEHYRFVWNRAIYDDAGDAWEEINSLMTNNYFYPYEHQWDYNPSDGRNSTIVPFTHSCDHVPGEPCSDTSPQPPAACGDFLGSTWCLLYEAGITGSKYQPTSATYFWNSSDPELSAEYMVLELAFNNAVVIGFTVSPAFESPTNGFVTYDPVDLAKTPLGGHVVHVVSFVSNEDLHAAIPDAPAGSGGGYFIVKNSWSTCFADGGYIYLPWDYVKAEVSQGFAVSQVN